MPIEVALGDDHAIVRQGIKAVISQEPDITVIAEAADGREVLRIAKENPPDVFIIDITMPLLNGLEAANQIRRNDKNIKIIILSMHDNRAFVEKALSYGVNGYVLKDSAADEIVQAVREVYNGRFFVSPKISTYLIKEFVIKGRKTSKKQEVVTLTSREKEVLQLIAEGYTAKEIAGQLDLSPKTVMAHRDNIMQKLDIHNQAGLIRYAIKEGLIS